jgi:membrane-bound lytic murein transglycosylase MltF
MTAKEKRQFVISQMEPKSFARHLIAKTWKDSSRQYKCLAHLWGKESAWNHKAKSPTHDYGIPQRHMSHNTPKQIRDFLQDPQAQIKWGLNYIESRYDSPCGALKTWLSRADKNGRGGWY